MPIGDERGAWSSPDSVPEDLAPGTVLGGYRIEGVAGRGGMGIVYRATQLSLGRIVALKVIDPVLAADPGFRRRFQDESALAASLDHPNVVTVHEAGEEGGRLYVSMRLVPGMDLGRLVGAEGPLDPRRAVHLVAGVAGALDAAHAAGLVHRDVKPSNVLVERRADGEHAILSDFGVVKRTGADAERTGSAGWVGSADFVAPEQVLGGPVDGRSDIYALGAVLYTALTGRVPFERPDLPAKLYASVNEAVPPLSSVRPGLPHALEGVIARATAKDPNSRYASAGELAAAARVGAEGPAPAMPAVAAGGQPPGREAAGPVSARKWWHGRRAVAAIAGLAAVALIVAFAVSAASGGGHPRRQPGQSAAAASPTSASAPSATSGSAGASSPGKQLAGIRTFQFTPQGTDQLTVTVYDLRRHGPFLTLDFKAAGPPGSNGDLAFDFYEGEGTFGFNSLDGIRLLDPVHNKVYRAVQDSQQNDWQSQLDVSLEAATSELLWVTFPAPPRSVKRLDVLFSNGGPQLTGVPITTASAGPSASQVGTGVEVPPPATFAEPRGSTDTSGLTLPVNSLILTVGNKSGADAESATSATVTLNTDVLFDFDKSNLTPQASKILRATAAKVSRGATGGVTVDGYTDSIGTDAVNIPLSQARAQAVVTALQSLTPGVSYTSHGHGSADPVAPNTKPDGSDNPAGRALNRRVTITYNIKAPAPPAPPPAAAPAPASSGGATGSVTYHAASGSNYRVRVDHLYREGDLVVADFGAKCLASFGNSCNYQTDFSAQVPSEGSVDVPPVPADQNSVPGFDSSFAAADAVYLEDPNGSIYDPAHDDANVRGSQLVANTDTLQGSEGPKPFEPLWAYFPAPPANVKTMSFVLPGGTTRIANVPVEARSPRS